MNSTHFLNLAAGLAAKIDPHQVTPNPRVGCVIVQNGEIIAEGVHENFGSTHAEVNAFEKIRIPNSEFRNLEFFITLEPCDHFSGKKTPSCTELLIKSKPRKVIIGSLDPRFQGANIEKLKAAGIDAKYVPNEECQSLNPFLEKFVTTDTPYLTLKIAQSLDGKIKNPKGKWISNETSRKKVHEMRENYSAILTTVQTILDDDPILNCRLSSSPLIKGRHSCFIGNRGVEGLAKTNNHSNPQIIILGQKERIPNSAKIFSIPDRKIHSFEEKNLKKVLQKCHKMGIDSIMTECGQKMNTELLKQNLVDEIMIFIAPQIFGGNIKNAFYETIDLHNFELQKVEELESDIVCNYRKNPHNKSRCKTSSKES